MLQTMHDVLGTSETRKDAQGHEDHQRAQPCLIRAPAQRCPIHARETTANSNFHGNDTTQTHDVRGTKPHTGHESMGGVMKNQLSLRRLRVQLTRSTNTIRIKNRDLQNKSDQSRQIKHPTESESLQNLTYVASCRTTNGMTSSDGSGQSTMPRPRQRSGH